MDTTNLPEIVLEDDGVIDEESYSDLLESSPTECQDSSDSLDDGWDTDIEIKEPEKTYDPSGRRVYLSACLVMGITPVSYFIRHIEDKDMVLRHHGLGPKGAKAIAIALVSNTTIVHLDLHDNYINDEGATAISDMLRENCYIVGVNLSCNNIGYVGCAAICQTLNDGGDIRDLNLSNNLLGDKEAIIIAEAIKGNEQLATLNLSGNRFSEAGGEALGPSIAANDSIEKLDLSWNHLRRRGAIAISAGLKTNCTLKVLDLSWNGCGDDCAVAVGDAIKGNNTLTELNIRNNRISVSGAVHIARGLEGNNTLEVLKIGQNPIETKGAHSILSAIRNRSDSSINELHLEGVYLDEDFFALLRSLNDRKALKVIGRSRPSERNPMDDVKQFITNNQDRWLEVFGAYDPDECGFVSKAQFVEGLKKIELNFDRGRMAWLCISLTEDKGTKISYKKPFVGLKKKPAKDEVPSTPNTPNTPNSSSRQKKGKKT